MKNLIIISALLLLGVYGFGQENTTQFVDIIPLFNGSPMKRQITSKPKHISTTVI
jgi:hypothetical protein